MIDDITELFGNKTVQPQSDDPNGFRALAMYDKTDQGGNADGEIGKPDKIYRKLRLWQDLDHDGISKPSELHSLDEFGVEGISLDYKLSRKTDEHGNAFRYRAKIRGDQFETGPGRFAWDVILQTEKSN